MSRRNNFGNRGGRSYNSKRGYNNSSYSSRGSSRARGSICKFAMRSECKSSKCEFSHALKLLGETRGHSGSINDVVMWNAQQQVLTCATDSNIKLWSCADWKEAGSISVSVKVPDVKDSSRYLRPESKNYGIHTMVLEGSWLFVGFESNSVEFPKLQMGYVRAWNLDNPSVPFEFPYSETMPCSHTKVVTALAVAVDGTGNPTLFSGSKDGSIRYWQLNGSIFQCIGALEGHLRGVSRMKTVVQPNATLLVSGSDDGTIKLFELGSFKCVKVITNLEGHKDAVTDLEIWVDQNEQFLISSGMDKNIMVTSLIGPAFEMKFVEPQDKEVTCICGMTDSNQVPMLAIGLLDGTVVFKDLPSFEQKQVLVNQGNTAHSDAVLRIVAGPANTFFTSGKDKSMFAYQWVADK